MKSNQLRIAMWSPPRARSTMCMRIFEALGCAVYDEPFYPYWLKALNKTDDPGFTETMAECETDWLKIIELILAPIPEQKSVYYQKHMAIHMLAEVDLTWMSQFTNCFLIRDPAEIIHSMSEFRQISAEMVGIPQLKNIWERACDLSGETPLVIDANDVLRNPEQVLRAFCERAGITFSQWPVSWQAGKHPYDGPWADAWYQKVFQTTELGPYVAKPVVIAPEHTEVLNECLSVYDTIAKHRITGE